MPSSFLIADDSDWKRNFLKIVVQESGIDTAIIEAPTSEEAIDLIEESVGITAAFIDYNIPSENGPEIIRVLREKFPKCHIALVTTADGEFFRKEAMDAGADAFVTTSYGEDVSRERLLELLEEWMGRL
ncbi:MAG: response regulator [Candidatus Peregrinibacteria bacterium]